MSASPPTPDVWLGRSEPTLRAIFGRSASQQKKLDRLICHVEVRGSGTPIRLAKRRFPPAVESIRRLVRSALVHVHHAVVAVACGSAGRCSTNSRDGKLDFDRAGLLELQRRLDHLALLQGAFEVHEH
jgi:hypothetical protein